MVEACEVVGEGAAELAVATSIDREDGLAGASSVEVQATRLNRIAAVPEAMKVRRILST